MTKKRTSMTFLNQFQSLLDTVDTEKKEELLQAFETVKSEFSKAIDTRDKAKADNRELKSFKDSVVSTLNLEGDDITADSVAEYAANLKKSGKSDEQIEKLTAKYEGEIEQLRGIINEKESGFSELNSKYNDVLFKSEVEDKGLLEGFKTNPLLRGQVVNTLKSKLIFKDGQMYVNDGQGEIAKDIKSGEPVPASYVVDSLKSDPMYADFIMPTGAHGGGKPPVNNSSTGPDVSGMSPTQKMKQR